MLGRRLPPVIPMLGAAALRAAATPVGYARFIRDRHAYRSLPDAEPLRWRDTFPQVHDRLPSSPYDQHYFHQDVWAAKCVADRHPARHVDVGSRVDYVGFLTAICEVEFVDIRPLDVSMEGLTCLAGRTLALPYPDRSVQSLSCLHVAEHIGLGRYGDPLDPAGTRRAAAELQRVLAPGGQLLFSGPVGRPRVCFNAHRIHAPEAVVAMFGELDLAEFSASTTRVASRATARCTSSAARSMRAGCSGSSAPARPRTLRRSPAARTRARATSPSRRP